MVYISFLDVLMFADKSRRDRELREAGLGDQCIIDIIDLRFEECETVPYQPVHRDAHRHRHGHSHEESGDGGGVGDENEKVHPNRERDRDGDGDGDGGRDVDRDGGAGGRVMFRCHGNHLMRADEDTEKEERRALRAFHKATIRKMWIGADIGIWRKWENSILHRFVWRW